MPDDESADSVAPGGRKPMGWLVGLGVLLITLGVVFGLIGIGIVAKRKQKYRINEPSIENRTTNSR